MPYILLGRRRSTVTDPMRPGGVRPRPARGFPRRVLALSAATAVVAQLGFGGLPQAAAAARQNAAASTYLTMTECCGFTTWSLNVYSPDSLIFRGLVNLPLAVEHDPSLTAFTPQVASSWSVSGDTLTIHVRPGLKWQTGQPVTATDVYDTILLDGAAGVQSGWLYWTNVAMPNSHEVVLTARPGTNMVLAEDQVLPRSIWPASVYGRFVTPTLKGDEIAYYAKDATDPAGAATMPQYTAIGAAFKKLAAYSVQQMVGDGPFILKAVSPGHALLVKSATFFDAGKVHLAGIDYITGPNEQIYPLLYSGKGEFSNVYMSPAISKKWQATPGGHTAVIPANTFNLLFNDHSYPLNITGVRQALAYVIPRKAMISVAYGTGPGAGGVLNEHPDGLTPGMNKTYLTPSQLASLNTYSLNPAKATSLLESAGFHKSGRAWIMPDGKPFSLTFLVQAATTDVLASFEEAASALQAFGIAATVNATQGATMSADIAKGDFQLSAGFYSSPDPLGMFMGPLGRGANFETLGSYAGDRGIGFGPTVAVPGIGTVVVPTAIDHETATVGPGSKMNALTYDWARLVNQQLPYLSYGTKEAQVPYSTAHLTWPPFNPQHISTLWNIMGLGSANQTLTLMMEDGYLRPKG